MKANKKYYKKNQTALSFPSSKKQNKSIPFLRSKQLAFYLTKRSIYRKKRKRKIGSRLVYIFLLKNKSKGIIDTFFSKDKRVLFAIGKFVVMQNHFIAIIFKIL